MAHGHKPEELMQTLALIIVILLVKISTNKVLYFVDTRLIHPNLWLLIGYGLSVYLASYRYLFEFHFILSKGAGFV